MLTIKFLEALKEGQVIFSLVDTTTPANNKTITLDLSDAAAPLLKLQNSDGNSITIAGSAPSVTLYKTGGNPITIDASDGSITIGGEKLTLQSYPICIGLVKKTFYALGTVPA